MDGVSVASFDGPDGGLLGVVVAAIDMQYLASFYQAIHLPAGESISLFRRDGVLLARYPPVPALLGSRLPPEAAWYPAVAANGGTWRSPVILRAMLRQWWRWRRYATSLW